MNKAKELIGVLESVKSGELTEDQAFDLVGDMAYKRNIAEDRIRNRVDTIINHVLKIAVFLQESTWFKEVTARVMEIQQIKMKGSRRNFDDDAYFRLLYEEPLEDEGNPPTDTTIIFGMVKNIVDDEDYTGLYSRYRDQGITAADVDMIRNAIKRFFCDVSDLLAKGEAGKFEIRALLTRYLADMAQIQRLA